MLRASWWVLAVVLAVVPKAAALVPAEDRPLLRTVLRPDLPALEPGERWVEVAPEFLSAANRGSASLASFTLDLVDGPSLHLTEVTRDLGAEGSVVRVCRIDGVRGGSAVFAVCGAAVSATIVLGEEGWSLRPVGDGVHRLRRETDRASGGCAGPVFRGDLGRRAPPRSTVSSTTRSTAGAVVQGGGGGPLGPSAQPDRDLDLLVVYTPDARLGNGGHDGIASLVALCVHETNESFSWSDVHPRVQVVHLVETAYGENGDEDDYVTHLHDAGDGEMDEVHPLRDQFGADLVLLIYQNGDPSLGGVAYRQLCTLDPATESDAFAVVKASAAAGPTGYAFPHEIGHLLGADHAIEDDNYVCQLDPFSFGEKTTQFRTVMAYAPGVILPVWSNAGKFDLFGEALGTVGSAENWRTLNGSFATVAAYRPAVESGRRLTTTPHFNANTFGNLLDLFPQEDLALTALETYVTDLGSPAKIRVWYRVGSYQGHEDSSDGWLLLDVSSTTSLGILQATRFDLDPSVFFHAGETYGLFVELLPEKGSSIEMRDLTLAPTQYQNHELVLRTGVGKGGGFSDPTFPDRAFCGTFFYEPAGGTNRLTTHFGGSKSDEGIQFDVVVKRDLSVQSFDLDLDDSADPGAVSVDVWYRRGSHRFYESDPFEWTYLGSDFHARGAGPGQPTRVFVGDVLLPNDSFNGTTTYAFYVHVASQDRGHVLRTERSTHTHENDDLSILSGTGTGRDLFGTDLVDQREFQGSIRYTPAPWVDLGHGLGDTSTGLPVLEGQGPLLPGSRATIRLRNAPPRALSFLILGFDTWYTPFNGGTLVPSFDLYFSLRTDPAGELTLEDEWPGDLLQGTPIYLQVWIPRSDHWVASNAVQATAQ